MANKLVAETFKAHGYEVDLIPTAELGARIVEERFAHYARTLGTNDTVGKAFVTCLVPPAKQ